MLAIYRKCQRDYSNYCLPRCSRFYELLCVRRHPIMSVQLPCNNNIVDIIAKKIRRRRASHEISKRYTYSELEHKAKVVVLETGNIHT
jgi:hypothetical protein